MSELSKQVAIVTGGASGIGAAPNKKPVSMARAFVFANSAHALLRLCAIISVREHHPDKA
jgi:hypothetical protein